MARSPLIRPFAEDDWAALWAVRLAQLAEQGVVLDPTAIPEPPKPGAPDTGDEYEWDLYHIDRVYRRGSGNFWLAWCGGLPIGYVGGQEIGGGALELRRMFVNAAYRRQGIGAALVRALIAHAQARRVHVIELWTSACGPGRPLYQAMGFVETAGPGAEFKEGAARTRYTPGMDEIRMRLEPRAAG